MLFNQCFWLEKWENEWESFGIIISCRLSATLCTLSHLLYLLHSFVLHPSITIDTSSILIHWHHRQIQTKSANRFDTLTHQRQWHRCRQSLVALHICRMIKKIHCTVKFNINWLWIAVMKALTSYYRDKKILWFFKLEFKKIERLSHLCRNKMSFEYFGQFMAAVNSRVECGRSFITFIVYMTILVSVKLSTFFFSVSEKCKIFQNFQPWICNRF